MGKTGKGKSSKSKDNMMDANASITASDSKNKPSFANCDIGKQNSSGCCVKMIFSLLLSIFIVIATVIYVDYKPGQLKQAYESMNIPPEVKNSIENGAYLVSDTFWTMSSHVKEQYNDVKKLMRNVLKDVDIGGVKIAHILFSKDIDDHSISDKKDTLDTENEAERILKEKRQIEIDKVEKERIDMIEKQKKFFP